MNNEIRSKVHVHIPEHRTQTYPNKTGANPFVCVREYKYFDAVHVRMRFQNSDRRMEKHMNPQNDYNVHDVMIRGIQCFFFGFLKE